MMKRVALPVMASMLLAVSGCSRQEPAAGGRPAPLVFWHTQAQENLDLLQDLVDAYNAGDPPLPVELHYAGNYTTLFQKVRAAVPANRQPDLVVAYESMVAEYIELDAIMALDAYIHDQGVGLSGASLDDIMPGILENNRYPAYGNRYYTFPFTKSVLMLYYNADLLAQAGFEKPPETWTEFKEQCLAVTGLGKKGYAVSVDASTVNAMIMSFGGSLLNEDRTRACFDAPAAVRTFALIQDLVKTGAAYQVDRESYGDRKDFAAGECAFMIRSSTTRPYLDADIRDRFKWDMAILPHAEGVPPVTVLFGANVAVMKTTPERQRAAWQFVRYFASTEVTAQWATGTGYLPVRRSAAETPAVQTFFAQHPRNRRAFDALPSARPEPGANGWQAIRSFIELAESRAIGGRNTPEEIAADLTEKANAALGRARE